jgi:hypothetical protein
VVEFLNSPDHFICAFGYILPFLFRIGLIVSPFSFISFTDLMPFCEKGGVNVEFI